MIANLKNYIPSVIEVVLSDEIKEMFPTTLLEGKPLEDILELFGREFVVTFPSNMEVTRKMDAFEIKETREEYCILTEDELPAKEIELLDAIEEAKRIKKDAEEKLESCRRRIAELASEVKIGTKPVKLSPTGTMQFCLNGFRLTYSFINGRMELVAGQKITSQDRSELWTQENKNREAMLEYFGVDYPEVERPEDAAPQNFEEALNDALEIEDKPTR